jgi:hypothetical protein
MDDEFTYKFGIISLDIESEWHRGTMVYSIKSRVLATHIYLKVLI